MSGGLWFHLQRAQMTDVGLCLQWGVIVLFGLSTTAVRLSLQLPLYLQTGR